MKNSKYIVLYVAIVVFLSILTGFIYGLNNPIELNSYLESLNSNNSLFLMHTLVIIGIFFSTLSLINLFVESVIFGIEGISIGFIISLFFHQYKLKGLLYAIITIIVNKGLYLLLLLYLFIISFNYTKRILNNIFGVNNDYINLSIKPLIKKFTLILIFSLINNTLIYFFGNMFLKYLTFML